MVVSVKNITVANNDDLNYFLSNAGDSLNTFRYFSTRPISVLSNHLTTILLYEDDKAIGYGHLDKDGETIWLGICVMQSKKNKGYGKLLMNKLIAEAKTHHVASVKLSVDSGNIDAINLYHKFGFINCNEIKPGILLMTLNMQTITNNDTK